MAISRWIAVGALVCLAFSGYVAYSKRSVKQPDLIISPSGTSAAQYQQTPPSGTRAAQYQQTPQIHQMHSVDKNNGSLIQKSAEQHGRKHQKAPPALPADVMPHIISGNGSLPSAPLGNGSLPSALLGKSRSGTQLLHVHDAHNIKVADGRVDASSQTASSFGSEGSLFTHRRAMKNVSDEEHVAQGTDDYLQGPFNKTFDGFDITYWGGKKGTEKDQDRELHHCESDLCIFAVMDGHGEGGENCAQLVKKSLQENLIRMYSKAKIKEVLKDVAAEVDEQDWSNYGGTTVAGVVINSKAKTMTTFHAGDSRVLWADKHFKKLGVTKDHDCENPAEQQRIREKQGLGADAPCYHDASGAQRIVKTGVMNTRSFGDRAERSYGVSNTAEVHKYVLSPKVEWIVMASDGIFGTMHHMLKFVRGFSDNEVLQYLKLAYESGTEVGYLQQMMDIGNSFVAADLNRNLPGGVFTKDARGESILKKDAINGLIALPEGVGDAGRPLNSDGHAVTDGNGDDTSVVLVHLEFHGAFDPEDPDLE